MFLISPYILVEVLTAVYSRPLSTISQTYGFYIQHIIYCCISHLFGVAMDIKTYHLDTHLLVQTVSGDQESGSALARQFWLKVSNEGAVRLRSLHRDAHNMTFWDRERMSSV